MKKQKFKFFVSYIHFKNFVFKNSTPHDMIYDNQTKDIIHNKFFGEKPIEQEALTEDKKTYLFEIEYSGYSFYEFDKINLKNASDVFNGILYYIFSNSLNCLNIKELEFHFTGSKNITKKQQIANQIHNMPAKNSQLNILDLFDYNNISKSIILPCEKNAFFGVTFKRIGINPISYSIRSGCYTNQLISFVFEGYDDELNCWDVLDERINICDLIVNGGYAIFFVNVKNKYYSSFQIRQIGVGSAGFYGFSLSAFDINGYISVRENNFVHNEYLFDDLNNDMFYNDNIQSEYDYEFNDQIFFN